MSADNIIDPLHPFDYLNDFIGLARSGAAWLEENRKNDGDGPYWDYEPDASVFTGHAVFNGDSGIALAFLQLWQETKDQHYLDLAVEQAESLARLWEQHRLTDLLQKGLGGLEKLPGSEWSYYLGVVGPAYVILEVGRAVQRQQLIDAGISILDDAVQHGRHHDGVYWSGFPGILLDGGILVVLAWAYDVFGKQEYAASLEDGAKFILSKAIKHDVGLSWRGFILDEKHADAEWPGFEFGTAGVGYALARVYQVTGNQEFLDAALEGARYLQSIAVPVGDGSLIPYTTLSPDIFYLGNCHGPSGTSRLAQELFNVTKDEQYAQWRSSLYRGLVATGAPQQHSAGYWHTSTLCCGTAAIVHFGVGLWAATGEEQYREFALQAARQLAGEAFLEGKHAVWPDAFTRVEPTQVSSRTPYFVGIAGVIAVLVEAERLKRREAPTLRLPEDPYPPFWK